MPPDKMDRAYRFPGFHPSLLLSAPLVLSDEEGGRFEDLVPNHPQGSGKGKSNSSPSFAGLRRTGPPTSIVVAGRLALGGQCATV